MDHGRRGIAVIFNQEYFHNKILARCISTNKDCCNLIDTLKSLRFEVWVYHDLDYDNILKTLQRIAGLNHSENDYLIIVVLPHGKRDYLYAADTCYKVNNLSNYFTVQNCPTLVAKPKLFFIQACQSEEYNTKLTDMISRSQNDVRGTWFIEALCSQLRENGTRYDLLTLLSFVCQRVNVKFNETVPLLTVEQKKLIPRIISMLTQLVKFTPNE